MENSFNKRKLIEKKDLKVILGLLLVCAAFFLATFVYQNSQSDVECEIVLNGETVKTVSLNKPREFSIPGKEQVVFEVKDGAIAFIHSDCADKVCLHSGYINLVGQFAACLPNDIMIKIVSIDKNSISEVDTVAN